MTAKEKVLARAPDRSEEQAERALQAAEGAERDRRTSARHRNGALLRRVAALRARQTKVTDAAALVREARGELPHPQPGPWWARRRGRRGGAGDHRRTLTIFHEPADQARIVEIAVGLERHSAHDAAYLALAERLDARGVDARRAARPQRRRCYRVALID